MALTKENIFQGKQAKIRQSGSSCSVVTAFAAVRGRAGWAHFQHKISPTVCIQKLTPFRLQNGFDQGKYFEDTRAKNWAVWQFLFCYDAAVRGRAGWA